MTEELKELRGKASDLQSLLEKYAQHDDDAKMILNLMIPLFDLIRSGKVVPSIKNEYRWYFSNTESPLFKYDDLCEAAARYSHALEGWKNR